MSKIRMKNISGSIMSLSYLSLYSKQQFKKYGYTHFKYIVVGRQGGIWLWYPVTLCVEEIRRTGLETARAQMSGVRHPIYGPHTLPHLERSSHFRRRSSQIQGYHFHHLCRCLSAQPRVNKQNPVKHRPHERYISGCENIRVWTAGTLKIQSVEIRELGTKIGTPELKSL